MIKKIFKWLFRIVLGLVLIVLVYGSVKQSSYDSDVEDNYPPTGKFSDIGNNKIHYSYDDGGDITFVMIAGLGETINTWSSIEQQLKDRGRVFMYDRSGLGHSENGILPRSVDNMANELQAVLKNESIPGPYILIGHSAGGFLARYFAKKYPDKVVGLFLIDPYQEMGKEELGEWPLSYKVMNWSFRNLSWSGIPYYILPNPPHPIYKTSKSIKTYGQEAFAEDISLTEFAKLDTGISNLPIYLLSSDQPSSPYNDRNIEWHGEIVAKYSNELNSHIKIECGHHIHIEETELVLELLDEYVDKLTLGN